MKHDSRPHGEKPFTYHPHRVDNLEHYRNEIDRIFKKGKYAQPVPAEPQPAEPVRRPFRAADIVHHTPSGEDWVLAVDEENGRVQPCGWPETMADAKDCTLITLATDEHRIEMLKEWAKAGKGYEHERDSRTRAARWQLTCCCETPGYDGTGGYVCNTCYPNPGSTFKNLES